MNEATTTAASRSETRRAPSGKKPRTIPRHMPRTKNNQLETARTSDSRA